MVTYPATAARGGVVSGVALATLPVRGTFLVAKWVGKGLLDYASLTENRQGSASSSGSAAADPSLLSTDDTPATSSQVNCPIWQSSVDVAFVYEMALGSTVVLASATALQ